MVRIDVNYKGDLRCEATHGPSQTRLVTDAPVDNQGKGESFSPTDLVATALISCMATIMGIRAREHNLDLSDMNLSVEKKMAANPRRIAELDVTITLPEGLSDDQIDMLKEAALNCPVAKSLPASMAMPVSIVTGRNQNL